MFSYGQYCPVAKSAEILGDRWTLLIVRELINGVCRFNEFHRGLPGISRSVLVDRLRRLRDAGVIAHRDGDYVLTESGNGLRPVIREMGHWAARWVLTDPRPDEVDPDLIVLFISRHVRIEEAPEGRTVLELDVAVNGKRRRYWIVVEGGDVSLCLKPPGFDADLVIRAEARTLHRIYMGWLDYTAAVRSGALEVDGPRSLVRAFPKMMEWSDFASTVRRRRTTRA